MPPSAPTVSPGKHVSPAEAREPRDRDRGDRGRPGPRSRSRPGPGSRRERRDRGGERDEPLDDVAGKPLADAVAQMLAQFDRGPNPVGVQRIAEYAQRRGRLTGDFQQIQSQILAAVRADNLRRTAAGQRSRFRVVGNRVALTDWSMDGELGRLEREINALTERFREASRRTLLRRVQDLPHRAMAEIMLLVLERIGMTDIQIVRRPGAHASELHLSSVARGQRATFPPPSSFGATGGKSDASA